MHHTILHTIIWQQFTKIDKIQKKLFSGIRRQYKSIQYIALPTTIQQIFTNKDRKQIRPLNITVWLLNLIPLTLQLQLIQVFVCSKFRALNKLFKHVKEHLDACQMTAIILAKATNYFYKLHQQIYKSRNYSGKSKASLATNKRRF